MTGHIPELERPPIAVYVHIPFCPSKCGYCDFNSYGMGADGKRGLNPDIVPKTVETICQEIEASPLVGIPAKTIFFGGGTPTFLSPEQLKQILQTLLAVHPITAPIEITTEANPGTVDAEKFSALKEIGFNRISIGVQSFDDKELLRLGRVHCASEAEIAYKSARQAGFININLDLMFGLPNQTKSSWQSNLDRAFDLSPDHLSLYCLTIEPGTAFKKQFDLGRLRLPSNETQASMFDQTRRLSERHGFHQYEISNFAKKGRQCEHNLAYWRGEFYAGYGPGAVAFLPEECVWDRASLANEVHERCIGYRRTNLKHPSQYCKAIEGTGVLELDHEWITEDIHRLECIMLGLRLNEGIPSQFVRNLANKQIQLIEKGWANFNNGTIQLTDKGQSFCIDATLLLMD